MTPSNSRTWAARAKSVAAFAIVSGTGLCLDVACFLLFTVLNLRAGYANLLSAFLAVTFVYFASVKAVFNYGGRFLIGLFMAYVAYQVVAVGAASLAVDRLVLAGIVPIMAKGIILPLTFTANYLFMATLTGWRQDRHNGTP